MPYGKGFVELEVPGSAEIIEPSRLEGLPDEKSSLVEALRAPLGAPPLREVISPGDRIVIVTSDNTRPLPNRKLIPWILGELPGVSADDITILIGTGSHRACSPEEIADMFGPDLAGGPRILNHDACDPAGLRLAGATGEDGNIFLNSTYLEAPRRITLGFIEPHFFAGFSGGPKALMPGIAGIDTIMRFHSSHMIRDPRSNWGVLEGNPVYAMASRAARIAKPDFAVNVTLNPAHDITGVFCGDVLESHRAGARFAKEASMCACDDPFDIVVTSNSGHPLDRNFYQAVKGICAAGEIVKKGGAILCLSHCGDGIPHGSDFHEIMGMRESPEELLAMLEEPSFSRGEAWQAHRLASVQVRAEVRLFSSLAPEEAARLGCIPVSDPAATMGELVRGRPGARVAVLRYGPLSIPYLTNEGGVT